MKGQLNVDIGGAKNERSFHGAWKILDVLKHVDYVMDLNSGNPLPFKNEQVDNFYCSHTLEHVDPSLTVFILSETYRCLKKRGRLRVVVPDLEYAIRAYMGDKTLPKTGKVVGGQKHYPPTRLGELMAWFMTPDKSIQSGHKMGFDAETLAWCLEKAGFKKIELLECNKCSGVFKGKDFKKYTGNSIFVEAAK